MTKTIGLAAITGLMATFVARASGTPVHEAAGTVADSSTVTQEGDATPKWLTDANVLSLLNAMNARQIAAASTELQAWRSDSVRAFATSMAREHSQMQHAADSVAGALHLVPVVPAIAEDLSATMQAQTDSLLGAKGGILDRAYVAHQIASHQLMSTYLDQLATVAERPEIQALVANASDRVASQITRAKALQASFRISDSLAADSVAKRAAERTAERRGRRTAGR